MGKFVKLYTSMNYLTLLKYYNTVYNIKLLIYRISCWKFKKLAVLGNLAKYLIKSIIYRLQQS